MTYRQIGWIIFSATFWAIAGVILLARGISLSFECLNSECFTPIFDYFGTLFGSYKFANHFCISLAILIGLAKAYFVLSKAMRRLLERIFKATPTTKFSEIFPARSLLVLLAMMLLGRALRSGFVPKDVRVIVDFAIGSALVVAEIIFLTSAYSLSKQKSKEIG